MTGRLRSSSAMNERRRAEAVGRLKSETQLLSRKRPLSGNSGVTGRSRAILGAMKIGETVALSASSILVALLCVSTTLAQPAPAAPQAATEPAPSGAGEQKPAERDAAAPADAPPALPTANPQAAPSNAEGDAAPNAEPTRNDSPPPDAALPDASGYPTEESLLPRYVPSFETEAPQELPYYEGAGTPAGYVLVEKVRKGLVIPGAIIFGVFYSISVSVASGHDFGGDEGWLAVPVLGPFITASKLDKECDSYSCEEPVDTRTLLAMDGVAQVAGSVLLITGLTLKQKVYVRRYSAELTAVPTRVGRDGYGLGVVGTF